MERTYVMIDSTKSAGLFQERLQEVDYIGYDLETTGLDWIQDKLRLAQFEVNGEVYLINFEDKPEQARNYFTYAIELIKDLDKTIIGHNLQFDLKFTLANSGIMLENVYDTQIAEMVLTAGMYRVQKYFSLDEVVELYCGVTLEKSIRKQFLESEVITDAMIMYSVNDVKYLKTIMELQREEAEKLGMTLVFDTEMKLVPIVALMEYDGFLMDMDTWLQIAEENEALMIELYPEVVETLLDGSWHKYKDKIENGIQAYELYSIPLPKARNSKTGKTDLTFLEGLTNQTFIRKHLLEVLNLNSTNQLKTLLQLCEYYVEDSKEGRILIPNTQGDTLEPLRDDPIIDKLLNYKEVVKKVTTYGKTWVEYIHPVTGRVHPQYNQVGTVTGRWSAGNPNPQNIPAEKKYRACVIPREGYSLATADYSQAELRFVGALSDEPEIVYAYINGEDIHAKTASIIYGKPIEEVTSVERSHGKTVNFSILYGSTAYGLAQKNAEFSQEYAEQLLERFFEGYPQLAQYIRDKSNEIWEHNRSVTPLGRIRHFAKLDLSMNDEYAVRRHMAMMKREGFNQIIQGGSADSLKLAMIYAYYNSPFEHDDFRFLIQVHDELVVEIKDDIIDEAVPFLLDCMERAEQVFLGDIPAKADCNVEKYWSK